MKDILRTKKFSGNFLCQVFSALLLDVSARNCQRTLADESRIIINQLGTQNKSEIIAVQWSLSVPTPKG